MAALAVIAAAAVLVGLTLLRSTAVLSAATIVAAFWLSGCSAQSAPQPTTTSAPAVAVPAPAPAVLPQPAALLDVLDRLADPAVPGTEKTGLVEAAPANGATTLDEFTKALKDNGDLPLTFTVTDIAWSDKNPGNAVANVTATTANPAAGSPFSVPMEFRPYQGGWQLARETADLLLSFGTAAAAGGAAQTPGPSSALTPTPTP